jgi:hypothetical protein
MNYQFDLAPSDKLTNMKDTTVRVNGIFRIRLTVNRESERNKFLFYVLLRWTETPCETALLTTQYVIPVVCSGVGCRISPPPRNPNSLPLDS